jgi:hypothetical protein
MKITLCQLGFLFSGKITPLLYNLNVLSLQNNPPVIENFCNPNSSDHSNYLKKSSKNCLVSFVLER